MANFESTYRHGRQKLYQAVDSLATGTGTIQKRLESAAMGLIGLQSPPEWLPMEVRDKLEAIIQELTRTPAQGNEGTLKATLQMMSDEECSKIAQRILSLFIELSGGV
jgi:hypothetical protein